MDKVTEIDVQPLLVVSADTLKVIIKSTTVIYMEGERVSIPKEVSYDLLAVPSDKRELVTMTLHKINKC